MACFADGRGHRGTSARAFPTCGSATRDRHRDEAVPGPTRTACGRLRVAEAGPTRGTHHPRPDGDRGGCCVSALPCPRAGAIWWPIREQLGRGLQGESSGASALAALHVATLHLRAYALPL